MNARANSKKPKTTFTVVIHPPDFGKEFNHAGNNANKAKGKAKANPKPVIPKERLVATLPCANAVLPKRPPSIGPVHEKETIANVSAIKKIPNTPPILADAASILFAQELGKVSS